MKKLSKHVKNTKKLSILNSKITLNVKKRSKTQSNKSNPADLIFLKQIVFENYSGRNRN